MSKSVLITGGLGYVGGRLVKAISENTDYQVRIGDRIIPDDISGVIKTDIIKMDVMSDNDLKKACKGIDCVIHLAAVNEIDSVKDPVNATSVNSIGTLKLLKASIKAGVEKFIYFSTAHIYGSPLKGEITENLLPRPVHPYAITHRVAEDFVISEFDKKNILGIVVRLSNSFGAPIHPNVNRWTLVANDLCRQAVTTEELKLLSSGIQRRDFITLSDVGRAVIHFIQLPESGYGNGIFNLGGENPIKIIDFATKISERCEKLFSFSPKIIHPDPKGDEKSFDLDYKIDKLKNTGFILKSDFNKEIDDMLIFCKREFGI